MASNEVLLLSMALRTVLVVKAVPKYVTLNKALDFKITTLLEMESKFHVHLAAKKKASKYLSVFN